MNLYLAAVRTACEKCRLKQDMHWRSPVVYEAASLSLRGLMNTRAQVRTAAARWKTLNIWIFIHTRASRHSWLSLVSLIAAVRQAICTSSVHPLRFYQGCQYVNVMPTSQPPRQALGTLWDSAMPDDDAIVVICAEMLCISQYCALHLLLTINTQVHEGLCV